MLLIHRFHIDPSQITGAISDNLGAMHGGDGGKLSKCIWVDAYCMSYAQFLCRHGIPEVYIPAQHNTKSNTGAALWRGSLWPLEWCYIVSIQCTYHVGNQYSIVKAHHHVIEGLWHGYLALRCMLKC